MRDEGPARCEPTGYKVRRGLRPPLATAQSLEHRAQAHRLQILLDRERPIQGGGRAALHRSTSRQRRSLPGRDGPAGGQELSGPAARQAGRTQGGACPAGDRLRPARHCRLCLRRLAAGERCRLHPHLRASHHRQLGRLSGPRSRPGSIPQSSGSTPCSTTSTFTARPTCCCLASCIRAGSSSSSPNTPPT